MRLNGFVDSRDVPLLFEALTLVDQRRRMARLRQLAALGLMVESAQAAASRDPDTGVAQTITNLVLPRQAPVPVGPSHTPAREGEAGASRPQADAPASTSTSRVTAPIRERPELTTDAAAQKRGITPAMLDMIDTGIMD